MNPGFCRTPEGDDTIITPHSADFQADTDATRRAVSSAWGTDTLADAGLDLDSATAWTLTRALSPRDVVRVASIVASDGTIANDYDRELSISDAAPSTPWAMYLSGDRERYDYLTFDLDSGHGNAIRDAGRLSLWLDELRIDHLVTESGPTGGRHIWIALEEPTDAGMVKEISQLAKSLLTSLDVRPLQNPKTGCVRPPGAVHRYGGISRPLGALSSFLNQRLDLEGVEAMRAFFLDIGAELPAPMTSLAHGLATSSDAQPYVPGDRRELSEKVAALLAAPVAFNEDASLRLATVLAGMANANWQYSDLAPYASSSPAFEHVRTVRRRETRSPRTAKQSSDVLARAWRHAVEYVASHPATAAPVDVDGTGYLPRLEHVTSAIQALQERANAMPGLWGADRASQAARARRGTYSRRAVLDALCLFMVQSASTTVEADCRRLALHTGYGKTTTAEALRELTAPLVDGDAESAWIVAEGHPERGRGQRYRLSKRFSTEDHLTNRTQALHGPPPSALAHRDRIIRELGSRLEILNQDVFAAPHSLGRHAGNVYRHLTEISGDLPLSVDNVGNVNIEHAEMIGESGTDVAALSHRTGLSFAQVRAELAKLERVWLAVPLSAGWARPPMKNMHIVAMHLDVAGYLEDRGRRYQYERERWGLWLNEVDELSKRRRRRGPRPDPTSVPLFEDSPARARKPRYPRKLDGSWDHSTALRIIAARHAA